MRTCATAPTRDSYPFSTSSTAMQIPAALASVETVHDALEVYLSAGLKPILINVPTEEGGCSCGQTHERTASGSTSAGKHPISKKWQKHLFTLDELRDQLARLKFIPNIGVVLGQQPGGEYLIAVDVDDADRIAKLEEELGTLPSTARCDSGRGYRLFYRAPLEIDTKLLTNVTGLTVEGPTVSGVDIKVEGGQVVVAPSLHANGKRYAWTRTGAIEFLPTQWAMALLRKPETPKWVEKYTPTSLNASAHARSRAEKYLEAAVHNEASALAACGQGMRNDTLFKSACRMFKLCGGLYLTSRWEWIRDELASAARASGLAEAETRATLASADRTVRESGEVIVPEALQDKSAPASPTPNKPNPETEVKPKSKLPIIKITTKVQDMAEQSVQALRSDLSVYQRDRRLVKITVVEPEQGEVSPHEEINEAAEHKKSVAGGPQIHLLTKPVVKGYLGASADYHRWVESSGKYKLVPPPDDVVAHVHDQGEWPGIRLLVGITETPIFGPDGKIIQKPGYDPDTCYEYMPECTFPPVRDERTSQADAKWALEQIKDVFCDFPYVSEAHRSVPIAAILTLLARPAILGSIPAILFDASGKGAGKTKQTDIIARITTGRDAPRMNYTSDEVELEKILGGYALKGSPYICLDNVPPNRPFGGGPIDRCITARDKVDLRILGRSAVPTLLWRALIMATGNNLMINGDTSRRVLIARLESQIENPESRTDFKYPDVLAHAKNTRARLVSAGLLILRAYHRAGRPDMGCPRWGSFEEWSRLIPHAIVFAGGADPMDSRPGGEDEVDLESQALGTILTQLPLLHSKLHEMEPGAVEDGLAARTIIAALYDQDPPWTEFEPLRDAIESMCRSRRSGNPDATALGFKLRALRGRVLGGRRLISNRNSENVTMWKSVTV